MKNKELDSLLAAASDNILSASCMLLKAGARREVAQCDMIIKHIADYRDGIERANNGK